MNLNFNLVFRYFDLILAVVIYVLSVIAILRYPHGYIIPVLIFCLFLLPLQFAIWFIPVKIFEVNLMGFKASEIVYLIVLKITVILSLFIH